MQHARRRDGITAADRHRDQDQEGCSTPGHLAASFSHMRRKSIGASGEVQGRHVHRSDGQWRKLAVQNLRRSSVAVDESPKA
jgi:hypothetical protein